MISCVKDVLIDDFWIMPQTPEYIAEGIPYITSKNIKNDKIDFSKVNYISRESFEQISKNRPILHGDILISMIGTLGETAEVTKADGVFYGQNMFLVRLNESKIDKRYFLNYFKSDFVARALAEKQNQSTQKYLKANHIEDLQIPILPLLQQKQIAAILDKISSLIFYRQQQLQQLDGLVKARFVEMFGNVDKEDILINLCNFIDYRGKTPEKVESGLPFITAKNIKMHYMSFDTQEFISKETYDKVMTRGFPRIGDVVFTTEAPLGNVCRIPYIDTEFYIGQRIITMQTDCLEPAYLEYALSSEEFKRKLIEKSSGSTVTGIRSKLLEQLTIPVPNMEMQKQFADFVKQIDKSKFEVQQSLEKLETLKKSLMQQYFG